MGSRQLALLCLLFGLARALHRNFQVSCSATFKANSYPSVRRSGNSANGWQPHAIFQSQWFASGFVSDVNLEHVVMIRSQPVEADMSGAFDKSVSNATVYQKAKSDYLEVGDIVSFDVVIENDSAGFQISTVTGEMRAPGCGNGASPCGSGSPPYSSTNKAPAQLAVKLGCADTNCYTWAGRDENADPPVPANMFRPMQFIETTSATTGDCANPTAGDSNAACLSDGTGNPSAILYPSGYLPYSVSATLNTDPQCADPMSTQCWNPTEQLNHEQTYEHTGTPPTPNYQWGCCQPHVVLDFNSRTTNSENPGFDLGTSISSSGGDAVGTILAECINPPADVHTQFKIKTKTTTEALQLTDAHCITPEFTKGTAEGESNMLFINYNPPPPPKTPPSTPPEAPPLPSTPPSPPPSEPPRPPPSPSPSPPPLLSPPTGCRRDDDSDGGDGGGGESGSGMSGDGSSEDSDCSESSDGNGDGDGSGSDADSDNDEDAGGSDEGDGSGSSDGTADTDADSDSDNDNDDGNDDGDSDSDGSGSNAGDASSSDSGDGSSAGTSEGTADTDGSAAEPEDSSDSGADAGDGDNSSGDGSDGSDDASSADDATASSSAADSSADSAASSSSASAADASSSAGAAAASSASSADSDAAASATDGASTDNGSTADTDGDSTDGVTGDSTDGADNSGASEASSGDSVDDSDGSSVA